MGEQPGCVDSLKASRKAESPSTRVFFMKREFLDLFTGAPSHRTFRCLKCRSHVQDCFLLRIFGIDRPHKLALSN